MQSSFGHPLLHRGDCCSTEVRLLTDDCTQSGRGRDRGTLTMMLAAAEPTPNNGPTKAAMMIAKVAECYDDD